MSKDAAVCRRSWIVVPSTPAALVASIHRDRARKLVFVQTPPVGLGNRYPPGAVVAPDAARTPPAPPAQGPAGVGAGPARAGRLVSAQPPPAGPGNRSPPGAAVAPDAARTRPAPPAQAPSGFG